MLSLFKLTLTENDVSTVRRSFSSKILYTFQLDNYRRTVETTLFLTLTFIVKSVSKNLLTADLKCCQVAITYCTINIKFSVFMGNRAIYTKIEAMNSSLNLPRNISNKTKKIWFTG